MTISWKAVPAAIFLLAAASAGAYFDRRIEIGFDPASDGPISIEKSWVVPKAGNPGMCLTSSATGTGATGTAVYTPCTVSTSASAVGTTSVTLSTYGSGGGPYGAR